MLHIIGIGLNDEKDISVKGLEIIKKCKHIYLEYYTSKLSVDIKKLEKFYGKKLIVADRALVENTNNIIDSAKKYETAFLIIGDPFSATTHINFILECKKNCIPYDIIHNASIVSSVGEIGLELYKYGKVTSIPFNYENVKVPMDVIKMNLKNNLHTLVLLDLDPLNNKFLSSDEAINYLMKSGFKPKKKIVVCCSLGKSPKIIYAEAEKLSKIKYNLYPQCLIIPADKLHFVEEEALEIYSIKN